MGGETWEVSVDRRYRDATTVGRDRLMWGKPPVAGGRKVCEEPRSLM